MKLAIAQMVLGAVIVSDFACLLLLGGGVDYVVLILLPEKYARMGANWGGLHHPGLIGVWLRYSPILQGKESED